MKLKDTTKKRLILIDLDGTTLMNKNDEIHPITKNALINASNNGHKVCIVTGRPYRMIKHIYDDLGLNTLCVNLDGSNIHDPKDRVMKRVILPINNEIIKDIINEPSIKDSVENILIEYYNKTLLWKKDDKELEDFFHLKTLDKATDEKIIYGSPYKLWNGPSNNIVIKLKDKKNEDEVLRALIKYHDAVKIQSNSLHTSTDSKNKKPVITITNKNADKGSALIYLAQYYNKDITDVIAFGDQLNDFEMLSKAGIGIAMKNSDPYLKFISKGITHYTNDEGGLGHYLENLLNGEEL